MKHSNISIFIPHLGCPFNCIFCDQFKITGSDSYVTPFDVDNVLCDALKHPKCHINNTQIAFFGGSFTAIDRKLMIEYLEIANKYIGEQGFDSIRISTRPDCIDRETLEILKRYSVKTIELGIQSLDDTVLKLSKRGHTVKKSLESCKMIQEMGFELGMQMMCGLPGDSFDKDIDTAKQIIDLGCKQVRIYPVVVIDGTVLADMYNKGDYTPLTCNDAVNICAYLYKMFTDNGVTVLKVGLHSDSGSIAGPFHPAFGELVRSQVFYNEITSKITKDKQYTVCVAPNFISTAKGNGKSNEIKLRQNGYRVEIVCDKTVDGNKFVINDMHPKS